jgi:carbamoyl-phosphate synthase large subunit
MPKRSDIHKILVVGSGPIIIGQACEFDYSGTQAVKALKAEGYEVVLVNSNPATIMTDPELADRTYVEPLSVEYVEKIIEKERPDAVLPTVGGQTALNLSLQLAEQGILQRYGVELIGASAEAIRVAEDRQLFREAMEEIGLDVPRSLVVQAVDEALAFAAEGGYPVVIRPSFTLGGTGGGIAYNAEECVSIVSRGLELSPVHEVLVEESLIGWKEYELEVMRDTNDNVVIICSIENIDPMGVHTGDSITVAPAQTLTDREYQVMRDAAMAILRKVGVDTGGSNVQFGVSPVDGRMVVIEMNPRVSRSSALASKATGFPIAKIAAKLAVGYTLDEIPNDITLKTPAAFEPTIDYVVTKIPKFAFEKFPGADRTLGTQMKSVGEVMAIGRTFKESVFKALRSMEATHPFQPGPMEKDQIEEALSVPNENRLRILVWALEHGWTAQEVTRLTRIDPWFVDQLEELALLQRSLRGKSFESIDTATLRKAKQWGFSDRRLAHLTGAPVDAVRARRHAEGLVPVYKRVDTCAAEFESFTPYMYSSYEEEDESDVEKDVRKVMILGSGPNRIGQGIEFDYCCCHASFTLKEEGVQSIMVNCNPETVSTDYDTSDRLYFEPLTLEDVLEIVHKEKPDGVIVQLGGQTPLNLTVPLHQAGVPVLGTPADAVDLAENRKRFNAFLDRLGILYPPHDFADSIVSARAVASRLGYPVLVRPSYVLGGRAMAIVHDEPSLDRFVLAALEAAPNGQVLIDKFLDDAYEVDVDALSDGQDCMIAGIMEHIEQAGIHSGDSCSVLPTYKIEEKFLEQIRSHTRTLAKELGVVGFMNVQYAVCDGVLYVIEVNPRASRTVPYLAKATGVPLVKVATRLMLGKTLKELGFTSDLTVDRYYIKAPVFPFVKFPGVDPRLSPEMRSTGEVMGVSSSMGMAFYKAQLSAGMRLPVKGSALITVNERDHKNVVQIAQRLLDLGFDLKATRGTAAELRSAGLPVQEVLRRSEGRPHCVDLIKSKEIDVIINTPLGVESHRDGAEIRMAAVAHAVPLITTLSGAAAAVEAIAAAQQQAVDVLSLQEQHM